MSEEISFKDYLDSKIDGLESRLLAILNPIKEQTTKTNGRVNKLDEWKNSVCRDLDDIIKERKDNIIDNRKRFKDLIWSFARPAITVIITALITTASIMFSFNSVFKIPDEQIKRVLGDMAESGQLQIELK